jgi:hypothetical protein
MEGDHAIKTLSYLHCFLKNDHTILTNVHTSRML